VVDLPVSGVRPPEVIREQEFDWLAEYRAARVAEQLLGLDVHEGDPPVTVHTDDGIGNSLQQIGRGDVQIPVLARR
jgi:hypothetical protein